jgi:long-subunit fatty acid transport protein
MKKYLKLLFFLFIAFGSYAQNGLPQNAGARGAAMGNAAICFDDVNAAYANQAGLAFVKDVSFSAYGERRFMAEGLNSYLFAAALPFDKIGTFGLAINYFGFSDYNEQKIGLNYARKLAKNFSLGVQLDYLGTRIPNYGVAHAVTVELGILAKLNEKVSLGAHVYNPVNAKIGPDDRLPTLFSLGLSYEPSKKVFLSAQLDKDIYNHPFIGRFGLEYRPLDAFYIRAGVSAAALAQASFGIGVNLQQFKIDFSSSYHQVLGFTPAFSLIYSLQKKN